MRGLERRTEARIDQMIGNRWIELEDKGWEGRWVGKEGTEEKRRREKKSIGKRKGIGEEKKGRENGRGEKGKRKGGRRR
jgi:hypothetical protein